ncbi:MAG: 6,7-dimethyl-8-ribityllumazine synthase [Solitalea-like symbiont of Acarus siro]
MSSISFDIVKIKGIRSYKVAKSSQVAIFCSEWHKDVTLYMLEQCESTLHSLGVRKKFIHKYSVQGALELPLGAQFLLNTKPDEYDAIICIGCVIKGDTPHFEYVCQGVSSGILKVSLKYNIPIISGVLTTFNKKQAEERIDGSVGNKGAEIAIAAISMIALKKDIQEKFKKQENSKNQEGK